MIRAVYCDAVGTLLHPARPVAEVYAAAAARQGVMVPVSVIRSRFREAFQRQEEVDRRRGWRVSEERERQRWQQIVRQCLSEADEKVVGTIFVELYEHFATPAAWRVEPGAAEVLQQLRRRGLVVGIASNYDGRLQRVVAGLPELEAVGRRLVISAAVGYRKPAAEFFTAVVRQAGCSPVQVVYVGDDWSNDCLGAAAAGLRPVWYVPASSSAGRGTAEGAGAGQHLAMLERAAAAGVPVIAAWAELPPLLQRWVGC